MEAIKSVFRGMASIRETTTQCGEPDETTEANMLAKNSEAAGARMLAK